MRTEVDNTALAVFLFFFALVTVMGFVAARWRRPKTLAHLDEWGLGGRQFGTWITWFLVGGDFYTAYTVIAVPALVYSVGAYGFFALPYTIIVYPFVFTVMPKLWLVAKEHGYVTAADVVHGWYESRALELAVAATGVIATMPYIALQLVGMATAIKALGVVGEFPLIAAFVILALYTYSSGLRAPALIAFVKDAMIYIAVIAAIALIPGRLGGYSAVFAAADEAFKTKGSGGVLLAPNQYADRLFPKPKRKHHPQERCSAARLHPDARTSGPAGLYGPRGASPNHERKRRRARALPHAVCELVLWIRVCRDRNRSARSSGGHEHRR